MDFINQISGNNQYVPDKSLLKSKDTNESTKSDILSHLESQEVIVESSSDNTELKPATYKPDMDKLIAMKEETDARMLEMFKNTIKETTLKQLGGYRGIISNLINSEETGLDLDLEITDEAIEKAKEEIAEGGYWSAEETSTRLVDFAKALSGGDSSKADQLLDGFKAGFELAEKQWGGELPEISKETYDLTLEKFDAWKNGENEDNKISEE